MNYLLKLGIKKKKIFVVSKAGEGNRVFLPTENKPLCLQFISQNYIFPWLNTHFKIHFSTHRFPIPFLFV